MTTNNNHDAKMMVYARTYELIVRIANAHSESYRQTVSQILLEEEWRLNRRQRTKRFDHWPKLPRDERPYGSLAVSKRAKIAAETMAVQSGLNRTEAVDRMTRTYALRNGFAVDA